MTKVRPNVSVPNEFATAVLEADETQTALDNVYRKQRGVGTKLDILNTLEESEF